MKHIVFAAALCLAAFGASAQDKTAPAEGQSKGRTVPHTLVHDMSGKQAPFSSFVNPDGPTVVSFWATWCKPCIQELAAFEDHYAELSKSKNLRLLAVSIDDARSQGRVAPFVSSRGWAYTVLLDPNADLKRAMNVANVPHTFLLDKEGHILWQHSSYNPGDEDELADQIKKLP